MLVNLDQLIEAAEEITPHNPLYQITIRSFDNNGYVPMRVVLEIGGLPFALAVADTALPPDNPALAEFKRRCNRSPAFSEALFSAYSMSAVTCESVTLAAKERHGPLRAFKARNREISRQTRLFKELFCEGDEELLQGEGL